MGQRVDSAGPGVLNRIRHCCSLSVTLQGKDRRLQGGIEPPRRDSLTQDQRPGDSEKRAPRFRRKSSILPAIASEAWDLGTERKALSCLKDEDDLTRPPAAQALEAFLGPGFPVLGFWSLRVQELGSEVLGSSAWGPQPL